MNNSSFQIEEVELQESCEAEVNTRGVSVTAAGDAIIVRDAHKSYKSGHPVINGLNMTVPCGSIYGLLGSSGCGKTTMLSCIVGQRKLDKGEIFMFGSKPGTGSIGVPGRNIGYMPQDISLFNEFSIQETLVYFAGLSGMAKKDIESSKEFLLKFLDLPEEKRKVGNLSGGQQRRMSLATALIHDPELLILDEPTVGVDPLLRKSIWLHLQKLVCSRRTTVLITTHYIEECRQADNIGILRSGRLLTEQPPSQLFARFGSTNLERIVLFLSRNDNATIPGSQSSAELTTKCDDSHEQSKKNMRHGRNEAFDNASDCPVGAAVPKKEEFRMACVMREQKPSLKDSLHRVRALAGKNMTIILRNPLLLYFVLFISATVISTICLALGKDPVHLKFGIVNHEVDDYYSTCPNISATSPGECETDYLSCRFINSIQGDTFDFKLFDEDDAAASEVRRGNLWGYISFPGNFSENLVDRMLSGSNVDDSTLNASQINVRLDETNSYISVDIKKKLFKTLQTYMKQLFSDCGYDERLGENPLQYHDPIFGMDNTDFREFLAPSVAPSILFFYQIVTTSNRYLGEKKNGILERTLVGGAKTWEIILAYSLTEFLSLLFQSLLCYTVITHIFGIAIVGSHALIILIFFLNAYSGVSMGFLLGFICTEEIQAAVISISTFFPSLFLSGLIWPVEGMEIYLQKIAPFLPNTLTGEAIRSVISRGFGITHGNVWPGVLVPILYILIFFTLTVLSHKLVSK